MLHYTTNVQEQQHVELLYLSDDGKLSKTTIINPLWVGTKGVMRNIDGGISAEVSLAMQSQLFAMLDRSRGDKNWMQSFDLKDKQQQAVYKWQSTELDLMNTMSPCEMGTLMKNVLNVARLPWITLQFVEKGDACMFAISMKGGKSISSESTGEDADMSKWGWLITSDQARFEKVGTFHEEYQIRISDMRLVMVMSWAMNAPILLHELAHYITFMSPTPYRMNRGEKKLSFAQYEELFAGHGSVYMAVFARLLIDFHSINEKKMHESLANSGLNWFPINGISPKDITSGITEYCKKWQ